MTLITQRYIDELGRIVLPAELRTVLGLTSKSKLSIYRDGERIVLTKSHAACKLCGSDEKVNETFALCQSCIDKIINLILN